MAAVRQHGNGVRIFIACTIIWRSNKANVRPNLGKTTRFGTTPGTVPVPTTRYPNALYALLKARSLAAWSVWPLAPFGQPPSRPTDGAERNR